MDKLAKQTKEKLVEESDIDDFIKQHKPLLAELINIVTYVKAMQSGSNPEDLENGPEPLPVLIEIARCTSLNLPEVKIA